MAPGANDSTPAAEKERHSWSHQSGLWRRCHLGDPSTAARQRDCHKNRPQGEVRSLFTLISHSVGWNNNHSGSLYRPMHRRLKTVFKARWKTAWKGFKSVFPHGWSNRETSHQLIIIWLSQVKNLDQLNRWKLYWWLIVPPRTSL